MPSPMLSIIKFLYSFILMFTLQLENSNY